MLSLVRFLLVTTGVLAAGCDRVPSPAADDDACARGDKPACERRLQRMKEGCAGKDLKACVDTADAYATPIHAPKDDKQSAVYYERACDLGDGRSCAMLADQRFAGRGIPRDVAGALVLDERACTLGYANGCKELADCLERADAFRGCRDRDLRSSRELWSRYCELEKTSPCDPVVRIDKLLSRP